MRPVVDHGAPKLLIAEEEGFDFEPVVDAGVAGDGDVVGGVVEDSGAGEGGELAGVVVDKVVGAKDGLVAAEDDVGVGEGGEVALEPAEFGIEGAGDFHGGGGDEDFVAALELGEDAGGVGHDVEVLKEVRGAEVVVEDLVVGLGDDLPEALAAEVFLGEIALEFLVVAGEMLGDGVGHDFVHVNADTSWCGAHGTIIDDGDWHHPESESQRSRSKRENTEDALAHPSLCVLSASLCSLWFALA